MNKLFSLLVLAICFMSVSVNAQITSKFIGKFVAPNTYIMRDLAPATTNQIQHATNFNHSAVTAVNILDENFQIDPSSTSIVTNIDAIWLLKTIFINLDTVNGVSLPANLLVCSTIGEIPTSPMPANSTLIFTDKAVANASVFAAIKIARPANIILTQHSNHMSPYAFTNQVWLHSFRADKMPSIDSYAFAYCTALNSVSLPSAAMIYSDAFDNCSKLKEVILGATAFNNLVPSGSGYSAGQYYTGSICSSPITTKFYKQYKP
jgi:hypothetical protein